MVIALARGFFRAKEQNPQDDRSLFKFVSDGAKETIEKISNPKDNTTPFDPSQIDDPLAKQIGWTSLVKLWR